MNQNPTCNWRGASGAVYTYHIWDLPAHLDRNQYGNYIYCKKDQWGTWIPIYIGEGDLADRISDQHHRISCIKTKGATHAHLHKTVDEQKGKYEEGDLLAAHPEAYVPNGCNVKPGG